MAYKHEDRTSGQLIRSADWNSMGHEIERLEADKLNRAGDTITGDLSVTGKFVGSEGRFTSSLSVTGITTLTGSVGIGTTSPKAKLEVAGVGGGSIDLIVSGRLQSNNNDGGLWVASDRFIGGHSTDKVGFYNGGLWQLTVQKDGNVGVGTSSPGARLHLAEPTGTAHGVNSGTLIIDHDNSGGASSIVFRSKVNRGSDYGFIQYQDTATIGGADESARLIIGTSDNADDHVALMPSGNVGVGTADPKAKLEVVGAVVAANSDRKRFVQLWSDNAIIANSSAELRIGFATDLVYSNWSEKMRITTGGNVGIGTLDPGAYKLRVSGDLMANRYVVQDAVDGGGTRGIWMWSAADSNWGVYMSSAGAGKSLAGQTAVAGYGGGTSHSIRLRTNSFASNGLIYENSNEQLNFSVRASDGLAYIRGGLNLDGSLSVSSAITPSVGAGTTNGIMFPTDPFGGSGDAAWIRYHNARGGEKGTLEIGISNEADDHIALMPSGYVGIGTTDPKAKLEVVGTVVAANSDRTRFVQLWSDNAIIANSSAELRIGFATDLVASSWSEKMRITAAGNVGIGTTSPGAPLHVASYMAVGPFSATVGAGGIDVTGPTAEFGFVRRSLTAWPATPAAGDRFVWYNPDGSARLWTEVKGDLLVVSKEGNVGIGTTNPQARLHVSPLGQSTGARGIQLDEVDAIGNLTNRHLNIYYEGQGTVVFYHQNTLGQFMPQDGLWYHNSDAVLKENIARLSNTLAKTLQLRPVHFTWRNTAMESIGFVAQEVEQVFPDLVSSVNVNGQEIKALPYTSFAVIAIAALQELAQTYDAKITALENQIKAFL